MHPLRVGAFPASNVFPGAGQNNNNNNSQNRGLGKVARSSVPVGGGGGGGLSATRTRGEAMLSRKNNPKPNRSENLIVLYLFNYSLKNLWERAGALPLPAASCAGAFV